ncbi:hypothetical protein NX722_28385 [Endozoicomonas gorgoniicola]|uniref:Uncharacterized protein n=1 Tax=Endozoicomonas gorgoniicola TaxID=1234144 RepID=A0ABT3N4B1_9GAMM|nr:hypothetical protein [Endozoicomonas gorgoniicola]MCW7556485.1 hypothetical protein [Endozoicomonas gorgoniicola]
MYQLKDDSIIRLEDNAFIPKDDGNRDYVGYKKWCDEGNTPEVWQPEKPTLERAKAAKLQEINDGCDKELKKLIASYPQVEVISWDEQVLEAKAYQADSSATTTLLDGLAAGRGIEKAELVQRVIAKAEAFQAYSGRVIGQRQSLEDRLNSAETVNEVINISVEFGV